MDFNPANWNTENRHTWSRAVSSRLTSNDPRALAAVLAVRSMRVSGRTLPCTSVGCQHAR